MKNLILYITLLLFFASCTKEDFDGELTAENVEGRYSGTTLFTNVFGDTLFYETHTTQFFKDGTMEIVFDETNKVFNFDWFVNDLSQQIVLLSKNGIFDKSNFNVTMFTKDHLTYSGRNSVKIGDFINEVNQTVELERD